MPGGLLGGEVAQLYYFEVSSVTEENRFVDINFIPGFRICCTARPIRAFFVPMLFDAAHL